MEKESPACPLPPPKLKRVSGDSVAFVKEEARLKVLASITFA